MTVADAQEHLDALRNPDCRWLIPRDEHGKLLKPQRASQTLKQPMNDKGVAFARTVLGRVDFQQAIKEFESGNIKNVNLELLCCEGCIMGLNASRWFSF